METLSYQLNGTTFTFAKETGALVSMVHPGCGELIQNGRGLVDLAWPVKYDYEILRADPCGKHKPCPPEIAGDDKQVTLTWAALPMNTVMPEMEAIEGGVGAKIVLTACEDGRSVSLRCLVENRSATPVRQILFPDFSGLLPVAGEEHTRFTGLKGYAHPFVELADTEENKQHYFAIKPSICGKFYAAGGYFDQSMRTGRWYDFGGLNGGMSLYCRHWGYGPDDPDDMGRQDVVWVKRNNLTNTLRIANVHDVTVGQGESYESSEYVLTPHAGGWVQGIGPYKAWVDQNKRRAVPPPQKVREMLGFRTIWANEQYPDDPDAVVWAYDDYPAVADDMIEHGLYSLNLWGGFYEILPMGPQRFYPKQGGFEAFKRNVALLREKNVDVVPLVSWLSVWEEMRERYGLEENDGPAAGWSQNLKAVPNFGTPYMERNCCAFLWDQENPVWIQDVKDALRFLRDEAGVPCICWDQYILHKRVLYDIIDEYRRETAALYPDADFSGESTFFFEADIDHLDYTWDWIYRNGDRGQDTAPYSYVVETTRPQMNVDDDPVFLKYCFMDNVMINVYPSKPENVNGSAFIRDVPALSKALKQCAVLRKAYLPYFLEGKILGDCVLTKDCLDARVTGYQRGERLLLFVVKSGDGEAVLHLDFTPFTGGGRYTLAVRDEDNQPVANRQIEAADTLVLSGAAGALFAVECTRAER